ncbi:MAG: hypothetical protein NXH91_14160 [Phyllobacteriaceae bacterium]|jgi:hypothetical protein|nr:hypothetical protein [Phyllobacteriaceae bacterium]
MMRLILAGLMASFATAAFACPDYTIWGDKYTFSGDELYSPKSLSVVAGGQNNLTKCGIRAQNYRGSLPGYTTSSPDFSITVEGISGYSIEFRVRSECDSVLLVNTAARNWYFDDDDLGAGDAKIRLTRPAGDGIFDVWVGTYDGSSCDARLIVETF